MIATFPARLYPSGMIPPRRVPLLLLALLALAACGPDEPALDRAALRAEWETWRASRDSLYASEESPVPVDLREAFGGLIYFPYDSTRTYPASLQPALQPDTLYLQTSTGEIRPMIASGVLSFWAEGRTHRLTAYIAGGPRDPAVPPSLFVPFRDQTTGRETYGGGRYLDVRPDPDGVVRLDFNRAYHPTCVVNPSYSCPIPPPQNTLPLLLQAGERYPETAAASGA
ncbi:MAG TPA: DUF1684 domain-containing protein [Bacteroidetes bacterium]|nr:DUF1684 domain-containing protein [Bacteroidota bacterium]HIL57070.1 DUF1684 domain-containing protein [Rhodothermales bacterium]